MAAMSVYVIALIEMRDREEYQKYIDGFGEILSRYDGEVLVVEDAPIILEGEWPYTRTVVIRFPDADRARRWYESEAYQGLAQHRHRASRTNLILAAGRR